MLRNEQVVLREGGRLANLCADVTNYLVCVRVCGFFLRRKKRHLDDEKRVFRCSVTGAGARGTAGALDNYHKSHGITSIRSGLERRAFLWLYFWDGAIKGDTCNVLSVTSFLPDTYTCAESKSIEVLKCTMVLQWSCQSCLEVYHGRTLIFFKIIHKCY